MKSRPMPSGMRRSILTGKPSADEMTRTCAITRPNQRLRIVLLREASHEVAHNFLENRGVQAVADELSLTLRGHEVGTFEYAEVVRDRCKRNRESLGDFTGGAVLFGQQLEDFAPRRISESAKQGVFHGQTFIQLSKCCQVTLTKSAPITSLHPCRAGP